MARKQRKYQHNASVLCGAEANKLMKRILALYTDMDATRMRSQFLLTTRELDEVEANFAMLGYMAREDECERYVRAREYTKLRQRRNA